jgi:hypothetical protein
MSKERLTEEEMLIKHREECMKLPLVDKLHWSGWWDNDDVIKVMHSFAAQEVEAAIAETKKQRDELLEALKKIYNPITGGKIEECPVKGVLCGNCCTDTCQYHANYR